MATFADASWGVWDEDIDHTFKSTSGHVHFLFGTPISWASTLQTGKPAQSSAEAEYVAAYSGATEGLSLNNLLIFLDIKDDEKAYKLFSDSTACIGMARNPVNYKKNKQVQLKYHWVRHAVNSKELEISYVPTDKQVADIFTKTIKTIYQFEFLRSMLVH